MQSSFALAHLICVRGAFLLAMMTTAVAGEPLHETEHALYTWKWAGDDVKAFRGDDESPQYLSAGVPMPPLTGAEKTRGFVVFQTHWMTRSFPITVPTRDQISDRIDMAAAPGEFEPATFLVRPQKDLKRFSIAMAGDLEGPGGVRIPAAAVDFGVVNGWAKYGNYYTPIRTVIAPILKPVDIDADYSEQFWITLEIPEDARPGVYKGTIDILVGGSRAHELVLEIEVFDIELLEPDAAFGMYFDHGQIPAQWATADFMEKYYRDMVEHGMTSVTMYCKHGRAADGSKFVLSGAAARELGIDVDNPPNPGYYGFDQEVVYDFAHNLEFEKTDPRYPVGLDVMMERAGRVGLLRRDIPVLYVGGAIDYSWIEPTWKRLNIPWPGGTPNAVECRVVADRARARGWPELLFYLMDEVGGIHPHWGDRMMLWKRQVIRTLHDEGVRTVNATGHLYANQEYKKWYAKDRELGKHEVVVNEQGEIVDELLLETLYHHLDVCLFSTTMGAEARVFDRMRAMDKPYWLYNCAQPALHPQVDRFHYGLYTWRTGARGFFYWHYAATPIVKDGKRYWPWMDEKGVFHNTGDVWPLYAGLSPMGPVPTISWEAVREGVDDYRYLLTLEKLIERARRGGDGGAKQLADEADGVVEAMMARIPIEADRPRHRDVGAAAVRALPDVTVGDYDAFRRKVADLIVQLR
ncbi:MAG: hypothetical protein CMJ18_25275 [Phycisphaeraceae bacterium]|nr:hypothetical protein [Phycisphaeraceae bacterium]